MTLADFRQRYQYSPDNDIIGTGGFAKVYKAFDTVAQRQVALKFFKADLEEKYSVAGELHKVMLFKHPNLIQYYDVHIIDSPTIYDSTNKMQIGVMEYANKGDYNDFMRTFPSIETIKDVFIGILKGLSYLHQHGVVHRDIKPQNLLIHQENGKLIPKICDFGLAKRLSHQEEVSSQLMGTMEYMAPEQFNTTKFGIDGRLHYNVDIWSLGVILFETFSGDLPFGNRNEGVTHAQVMTQVLQKDISPEIEQIMPPFKAIIAHCLIKNANLRVQQAEQLLLILEGKQTISMPNHQDTELKTDQTILNTNEKLLLIITTIIATPFVSKAIISNWQQLPQQKKLAAQDIVNKATPYFAIVWIFILLLIMYKIML